MVKRFDEETGTTGEGLRMITCDIRQGDVLARLREMEESSLDMCVTSPPYWGLRFYSTDPQVWGGNAFCTHDWVDASWRPDRWGAHDDETPGLKQRTNGGSLGHRGSVKKQDMCSLCNAWRGELGAEPTYQLYVDHMVAVFEEVWRVLKPEGTLWLNLGDCYATGAGKVGNCPGGGEQGARWAGPSTQENRMPKSGLKPKDLVGIPWRVAFALQDAGWYLRSDIIWSKPAPMPESVTDRPTHSHEYIFLLAKSEQYYYNHEAIKEPSVANLGSGNGFKRAERLSYADENGARGSDEKWKPSSWKGLDFDNERDIERHPNVGRNRVNRLVHGNLPGRDDKGRACNKPDQDTRNKRDVWTINTQPFPGAHFAVFPEDLIKPCILAGCPPGGTVLEPFCGSGTTLLVARNLGCNSIGIELNPEYVKIAERRLSQEVMDFTPTASA